MYQKFLLQLAFVIIATTNINNIEIHTECSVFVHGMLFLAFLKPKAYNKEVCALKIWNKTF